MAEKAKADASSAQEEAQAADKAEEKTETATAEKAAETAEKSAESGSKAESEPAAEKGDGGLPYTVKDGRATVVSKARAGKKIIAKTGEVIEFGSDGKASVRAEDAAYLSAIAGFEFE